MLTRIILSSDGLGNLEGDGVVVEVEVRWVLSHEHVTKDEVVESFWEGHGLDSKHALSGTGLGDLENVIAGVKFVSGLVNGEGHGWERVDVGAVLLDRDSLDQRIDDLLWSDEEGSSRVDDGLVLGGIDLGVTLGNRIELESPVFLLNNIVLLDLLVVLRVHTWDDHVRLLIGIVEIEREGFIIEAGVVEKGRQLVDRDSVISQSDDTRHLGGNE